MSSFTERNVAELNSINAAISGLTSMASPACTSKTVAAPSKKDSKTTKKAETQVGFFCNSEKKILVVILWVTSLSFSGPKTT